MPFFDSPLRSSANNAPGTPNEGCCARGGSRPPRAAPGRCSDDDPNISFPGKARIDVDTPDLRQAKKEAGVEPCRPGTGASDLPAVTLPCFGGGPDVDLSTLEGPLVVNLWAVWCGPCRKEMPVLEEFHQQYGDRVRDHRRRLQRPPDRLGDGTRRGVRRDLPAAGRPAAGPAGHRPVPDHVHAPDVRLRAGRRLGDDRGATRRARSTSWSTWSTSTSGSRCDPETRRSLIPSCPSGCARSRPVPARSPCTS